VWYFPWIVHENNNNNHCVTVTLIYFRTQTRIASPSYSSPSFSSPAFSDDPLCSYVYNAHDPYMDPEPYRYQHLVGWFVDNSACSVKFHQHSFIADDWDAGTENNGAKCTRCRIDDKLSLSVVATARMSINPRLAMQILTEGSDPSPHLPFPLYCPVQCYQCPCQMTSHSVKRLWCGARMWRTYPRTDHSTAASVAVGVIADAFSSAA